MLTAFTQLDPRKDATATRFERLSFDEAVAGQYAVMDQTAFALCRDRQVPIRVFEMNTPGAIEAVFSDQPPGTFGERLTGYTTDD